MRNLYKILNTRGVPFDTSSHSYYTYDDAENIVASEFADLDSSDIIFSINDVRRGKYSTIRNINVLFNKTIEKLPRSYIPLSIITPGNDSDILVSQGEGSSPVWKSYNSVFSDDIVKIEADESIILYNDTFVSDYFTSTVSNKQFVTFPGSSLETIKFNNGVDEWFSHVVEVTSIPRQLVKTAEDSRLITVSIDENLEYNKPTSFLIIDKFGNSHHGVSTPYKDLNTGGFLISKDSMKYTSDCVGLYLSDYDLYSSMTNDNTDNYVKNEIDEITVSNKYDIEVWGEINSFSTNLPMMGSVNDVSIGYNFGVVIDKDGNSFVYGDDTYGQKSNKPANKLISVSSGKTHSCGITTDGKLVSWGSDYYGQVTNTPTSGTFKTVVCHDYCTAAISIDNELFIWGDSFIRYSDVSYDTLEVKDISFGNNFFILRTTDNKLIGFGDDTYGQISKIDNSLEFESISCGKTHAAGITSAGVLKVWGSNLNNQGIIPVGVSALGYKKVMCGDYCTIALKDNGSMIGFGNDSTGCISGIGNTVYDDFEMNYNNVIGLKNGKLMMTEKYKKRSITGKYFSLKFKFYNEGNVITSIKTHLEKQ